MHSGDNAHAACSTGIGIGTYNHMLLEALRQIAELSS